MDETSECSRRVTACAEQSDFVNHAALAKAGDAQAGVNNFRKTEFL
jgi:hypothetical protein